MKKIYALAIFSMFIISAIICCKIQLDGRAREAYKNIKNADNWLEVGMTESDVIFKLGKPEIVSSKKEWKAYFYTTVPKKIPIPQDDIISGYTITFKDGKVVKWEPILQR